MQLQYGRPAQCTGRLEKEMRCYDLLDRLGVSYARIDHEAAMTMQSCAAIDEILGASICKNLLLCNRQNTKFYLLLIPGSKHFKTSVLSKQICSSRLSFADEAHMLEYLDITPGSLSVLGLMNDHAHHVELLIDRDLLESESIGVHPCINTSSLRLKTDDLMDTVIPALNHAPIIVTLPDEA